MRRLRPVYHVVVYVGLCLGGCTHSTTGVPTRDAATAQDSYDAVMRVADAAKQGGDYGTAVSLYRKAHSLETSRAEPLLALGDTLLAAGQMNEALAAYQDAAKASNNSAEALRGTANAYLALGRPELAMTTLQTALQQDPRNVKLIDALGIAADLSGDHAAAQAHYRDGLAIVANDGNLANNLALSLALTGDYPQAISVLQPFADSTQSTARQRQTLSLIFGLAGDRDAAARYARIDLDEQSVTHNLDYFDTLRELAPDARARALTAEAWNWPRPNEVTDIHN